MNVNVKHKKKVIVRMKKGSNEPEMGSIFSTLTIVDSDVRGMKHG